MINYYFGEKQKEFKASKVKNGTTKNNRPYTIFNIAEGKKGQDGKYSYDNWTVFSMQDDLMVNDGDKIVVDRITGIDVKEDEYNGVKSIKKTIFADVTVVSQAEVKTEQVEMTPINEEDIFGDTLPF